MPDPFRLQRFVDAQGSTFDRAREELFAGQKRSHWMWFIFPQIRGLGTSPIAQHYAISGREEAAAYLQHPLLGYRLRDITEIVNHISSRTVDQIFGYPDNLKFHSSITLFAEVAPKDGNGNVFSEALNRFFEGTADTATLNRLHTS